MYLLDTNVFVTAKNTYYGFDLVPGFWTCLLMAHSNQQVHSIRDVYLEMKDYGDELSEWVKTTAPDSLFLEPDASTAKAITQIVTWSRAQNFTPTAQRKFQSDADLPLTAHAYATGKTIVTLESSHPDSKNHIMIPDVCNAFKVKWVTPFTMLKQLGARFDLVQ